MCLSQSQHKLGGLTSLPNRNRCLRCPLLAFLCSPGPTIWPGLCPQGQNPSIPSSQAGSLRVLRYLLNDPDEDQRLRFKARLCHWLAV